MSNSISDSRTELFAILAAISIIFMIWHSYPRFVHYMDEITVQKPAQIIIPYKPNAIPIDTSVNIENSKFQQIGDRYGTYGDSYGSLNTLFSGLAFAMLIISLFMQRKELQMQRIELEAQRHEIQESNAIADRQREITEQQAALNKQQIHDSKIQSFYTLLFKFLDEKTRKIRDLELTRGSPIKDFYVLERFVEFSLNYLKSVYLDKELIDSEPVDQLELIFDDIIQAGHENTNYLLIHFEYFEYVCFILRFIEEHKDLGIENTAIKIFISHQSIDEMSSMFFVSLQDDELRDFILKYALLRKLNTYRSDDHFLSLVDKTLGEESYCP